MQGKNRIAVLHPQDSQVVTLDLSIEPPTTTAAAAASRNAGAKGSAASTPAATVKSMAREEQEAAAKTIDRIRLLFAPPRPKGQTAKRPSREELLASCPTVRVYGRVSEMAGVAEEDAKQLTAVDAVEVHLSPLHAGDEDTLYRELNTELPNNVFWKYARVLVLGESTEVRVFYNVPTITSIAPPGVPYVGLPLVCADIALLFAEEENVCYEWCVVEGGGTAPRVIATTPSFTPTADLVGRQLMLRLSLDSATGLWTELRLPDAVRVLPAPVARWQATQTAVAAPAFRVVTYNILYDDFCTSKSSKAKIYPFATDDILDLENRKVRIVQELLAYHPDIVCLQECGRDVFRSYLLPVMKAAGYDGVYMNKNGTVKEGCGFLFRQSRYTLVRSASVPLNYATLSSRHADLAAKVAACPEAKEALSAVTTIGAFLVLRDVASNIEVVVGNTHLFFHANACHIRILQIYMLLHWLHEAAATETATTAAPESVRPVVLCGDFNCTHPTGGYRLATTGQVEATHESWEKGKRFWWGCSRLLGYDAERLEELLGEETVLPQATVARKDFKRKKQVQGEAASPTAESANATEAEAVCGADGGGGEGGEKANEGATAPTPARGDDHVVTHVLRETLHAPPLHLQDAYQRTDPSLQWTNFTLTFREVIDYIFFSSDAIEVLRTIPIPPETELAENFALPNKKYPSDHVALVADLSYKA